MDEHFKNFTGVCFVILFTTILAGAYNYENWYGKFCAFTSIGIIFIYIFIFYKKNFRG